MTREEAINWLKLDIKQREYGHIVDSLTIAIKALEKEPILDKIRAEIEQQERWLMYAGYNAYNVDIAFSSIKLVIDKYKAESEG